MALYDINWNARLSAVSSPAPVGQCLVLDPAQSQFVFATAANRASLGRKTNGIALTAGDVNNNTVVMLMDGFITADQSGLGAGVAAWARIAANGFLERVVTPTSADDVVGWVEGDGSVNCKFGFPFGQFAASGVTAIGQSITDPAWYINPSTGSDGNSGTVPGSPLKTWAGLQAKWGPLALLAPTGGVMTITVTGSMPSTDPVSFRNVIIGSGASILLVGTATTVRTGSFTAMTAINRAANTPLAGTDGAMAGTWTTDLGRRVRITSGVRVGMKAYVAKDLGAKQARFSTPLSIPAAASLAPFLGVPLTTLGTFANGDPYVVETLSTIYVDDIDARSEGQVDSVTGAWQQIAFVDFDVRSAASTLIDATPVVQFYGCTLTSTNITVTSGPLSGTPIFNNCGWLNTGLSQTSGFTLFWGGLVLGGGLTTQAGGSVLFDGDVMIHGAPLFTAYLSTFVFSLASIFDSTGDGCTIYPGSVAAFDGAAGGFGVSAMWGSGNTGAGVGVLGGGRLTWDGTTAPTVTGTGGNFTLAGTTTARAWNDATGIWTAGTIACSWANLTTTVGGGGFGGSAFCLNADAAVISGIGVAGGPAFSPFTPPTGTGFVTVTAGALDAASLAFPLVVAKGGSGAATFSVGVLHASGTTAFTSSLIVNADVSASAAIASSKLAAPGSNTQVMWNNTGTPGADSGFTYSSGVANLSTALTLSSSTVAGAGLIRLPSGVTFIAAENNAGTDYLAVVSTNSSDEMFFGGTNVGGKPPLNAYLNATGKAYLSISGSPAFYADANGAYTPAAYSFNLIANGTQTLGGGAGVMYWGPANTVPTSSPANGEILYVDTGTAQHLRGRDQAGVIIDMQHGQFTKAMADANQTLTAGEAASQIIKTTGANTALRTLTIPNSSNDSFGFYRVIRNACTGVNSNIRVTPSTGAGTVDIAVGKTALIGFDSAGAYRISADV